MKWMLIAGLLGVVFFWYTYGKKAKPTKQAPIPEGITWAEITMLAERQRRDIAEAQRQLDQLEVWLWACSAAVLVVAAIMIYLLVRG